MFFLGAGKENISPNHFLALPFELTRGHENKEIFRTKKNKFFEVNKMDELSTENIQNVFMNQIMALTKKTSKLDSFDYQFSDRWL